MFHFFLFCLFHLRLPIVFSKKQYFVWFVSVTLGLLCAVTAAFIGRIYIYYIAINIKLLKCAIKAEDLACRYHPISAHLLDIALDIAHLLGCLLILPLHYVALDDVVMQ